MIHIENYNHDINNHHLFHIDQFNVTKHDFVMITGASGSGKTTLLNIIYNLSELKGTNMCFALQNNMLLDELTLKENLTFFVDVDYPTLHNYAQRLELEHVLDLPSYKLSEGQKQRASFLRTLLMAPDILLLDEITSKQNVEMIKVMMDILKEYQQSMTIIMVTHDLSLLKYANKHFEFTYGELTIQKNETENIEVNKRTYVGRTPVLKLVLKSFKGHMKYNLLCILCMALLLSTFTLSFFAGKSLQDEVSNWYKNQYSNYSLQVSMVNDIKHVDEMIEICNHLNIADYVLQMSGLKLPQTFYIGETTQTIHTVEIDNSLKENEVIFPSSYTGETVLDLEMFSGSKETLAYRWAGAMKQYTPQYTSLENTVSLRSSSQEGIMKISTQTMVNWLKQATDSNLERSNLLVNSVIFRFEDEKTFKDTKKSLETVGYYLYDYSMEVEAINKQITDQFNPFSYVSYFISGVTVCIVLMLMVVRKNSMKRSFKILSYLNYKKGQKNKVFVYENVILSIGAVISSGILLSLAIPWLNGMIDLSKYVSLGITYESLNTFVQSIPLYDEMIRGFSISGVVLIIGVILISYIIQLKKDN